MEEANNPCSDLTFASLVEASDKWIEETTLQTFPTRNNLIEVIAGDDEDKKSHIVEHAKGSRTLLHKQLVTLLTSFLELKRTVCTPTKLQFSTV